MTVPRLQTGDLCHNMALYALVLKSKGRICMCALVKYRCKYMQAHVHKHQNYTLNGVYMILKTKYSTGNFFF